MKKFPISCRQIPEYLSTDWQGVDAILKQLKKINGLIEGFEINCLSTD